MTNINAHIKFFYMAFSQGFLKLLLVEKGLKINAEHVFITALFVGPKTQCNLIFNEYVIPGLTFNEYVIPCKSKMRQI